MITPGKTYTFKDSGSLVMATIKQSLPLGDGKIWITTRDDEDYILWPEELTEV